ncbi:hypothetical protein AB0E63_18145 [Kribbella sp. NPDC026596]|uniref:hypothetical protein n=1 Tax=Kribbella sp. NPDC026596 TaxID=3155122 RepID=UPI00340FF0CD
MAVGRNGLKRLSAIVAVVALVAGCGAQRDPATETRTNPSTPAPPDLVRIVYPGTESDPGNVEIFADGNRRYRITAVSGPNAGYYQVWDGRVMLIYTPGEGYQRDDHPGDDMRGVAFFVKPETDEFEKTCPKGRRLGAKTLYGRNAVRYACDARPMNEQTGEEAAPAREISLDEQTGLILVDGPYVPIEVTFGPAIKADTFSTDIPSGAEPTEGPSDGGGPTEVPPDEGETTTPAGLGAFRLPAVGGGFVSDTSYRGKPLVLVVGSPSSLRVALARVLPMTGGGVKPVVVGVLIAVPPSDWKGSLLNPADEKKYVDSVARTAGPFTVPVGIDVKGAAVGSIVAGLPELIPPEGSTETESAVALVGSDGLVAHVLPPEDPSEAELRTWLAALS